jgi:integrase
MTKVDLPYVKSYRDRNNVWRHYFRRNKRNLGTLQGIPGSPEFMEAYASFVDSKPEPNGKALGTFGWMITKYYATPKFSNLKPSSKQGYRYVLEPLAAKHGHKPVTLLTDEVVKELIEEIGQRAPAMANLTKRVLRTVLDIAYDRKWIPRPVTGGKIEPYKGGAHYTWTEDELEIYEARWPLGTRERLAYALLLYTDQRGGDVVRMRRGDIVAVLGGHEIRLTQDKTGTVLVIPIHDELMAAIRAFKSNGLTLIGDRNGRPIARAALTELMRKAVKLAGLPSRCVPHGLRKSMLVRMSHNEATTKEMQSISGHRSTKELERYTIDANQARLARSALSKMTKRRTPSV